MTKTIELMLIIYPDTEGLIFKDCSRKIEYVGNMKPYVEIKVDSIINVINIFISVINFI